MLQLYVCGDTEYLGSLENTQEALQTSRVLNISTYARWRMN